MATPQTTPTAPFAAAPRPQAPVDQWTQLAETGARMQGAGLGQLWGSFEQNGAAKAAIMEQYSRMGEENASNIRQRFYKKEWEQVKKARVDPLLSDLENLKAEYEQATHMSVLPIPRTVSVDEGQLISEQHVQPGQPVTIKTPNEKEDKLIPGAPITPPNNALTPGQFGGVEQTDKMAFIDPSTGMPVDIMSDRGRAIHQMAVDRFWGGYGKVVTQLMDVMGDYQGNPYADYAAGTIVNGVIQQASFGVSGKQTPEEAEAYMLQRNKLNAQIEAERLTGQQTQQEISKTQGVIDAQVQYAKSRITDPRYRDLYGKQIVNALEGDKAISPALANKIAGINGIIDQREREGMIALNKSGVYVPDNVMSAATTDPGQLLNYYKGNSPRYDMYEKEAKASQYSAVQQEAFADPDAFIKQHPELEGTTLGLALKAGRASDPDLMKYLSNLAATDKGSIESTAFARSLHDSAAYDPRVQSYVNTRLNDASLAWQHAHPGEPMPERMRMLMATYPEAAVAELDTHSHALLWQPPDLMERVAAWKASEEARTGGRPGSPKAEQPEQQKKLSLRPALDLSKVIEDYTKNPKQTFEMLRGLPNEQLGEARARIEGEMLRTPPGKERNRLGKLLSAIDDAYLSPGEKVGAAIGGAFQSLFPAPKTKAQLAEERKKRLLVK